MANVSEWSTTAASNNSAAPDGAPEGIAPSAVNDVLREIMAATARWYQDANGSLTSGGSGNTYTLTTNNSHAALNDVSLLVFECDRANTGASTINVDSLGAKAVKLRGNALVGGELLANQIVIMAYNSTNDEFDLIGGYGVGASTFTPTLTCATPGNLSVSYSTQTGSYWKDGDIVYFKLQLTCTPTFSTASGQVRIAGLPETHTATSPNSIVTVFLSDDGLTWPAGSTQLVGEIDTSTAYIHIEAKGSGQASSNVDIGDFTSGNAFTVYCQGYYLA